MKLESWTLLGAILFYFIACTTARAIDVDISYKNPGTATYAKLEFCSALPGKIQTCAQIPSSCAGGSVCSARISLPHGQSIVSARANVGTEWSPTSNQITRIVVDPAQCVASDVCRFDADMDGRVMGADFTRLISTFGRSWITP